MCASATVSAELFAVTSSLVLIAVSVVVAGYLVFALLRPEKF
jgi:K+-transporting ATPase KdpF subunit